MQESDKPFVQLVFLAASACFVLFALASASVGPLLLFSLADSCVLAQAPSEVLVNNAAPTAAEIDELLGGMQASMEAQALEEHLSYLEQQHELDLADFAQRIEAYLQYPSMGAGCEIMSMVSVFHAMGYEVQPDDFAKDYVLAAGGENDMIDAYSGSPYYNGSAFPPAMAYAGNNYLRDQGSPWRFFEPQNATIQDLLHACSQGRPVLVWTTMGMYEPMLTSIDVRGYQWYDNEHCVVLYGQDGEDLLVMDPEVGLVKRPCQGFERIFVACGSHALVLTQRASDRIDESDALHPTSDAGKSDGTQAE